MKIYRSIAAFAALLSCTQASYGLAQEQVGPDKDAPHPTHAQPGWPAGMVKLLQHDSRVYSIWVNGNENFYFKSTPDEIADLIKLYSEINLREHVVSIKRGERKVQSFKGEQIGYNLQFHFWGGIALSVTQSKGEAETYDPTLTIYIDPAADLALLKQIPIPDNVILQSEIANWPKGKATKAKRTLWYAAVQFEEGGAAADFENNVTTTVILWKQDQQDGYDLGRVSHEGFFSAAFSAEEIADLKAGRLWLTLTVGNYLTKPRADDPRLPAKRLTVDRAKAKPIEVGRPKFYFGRLLFEDGSPPVLDPLPWPGAEISISWPYAGAVKVDTEGYFKVFFTPGQFEDLKAMKVRKNIYIPDFERRGTSTARFAFPAMELSTDKKKAGEMRIAKPAPKKKE